MLIVAALNLPSTAVFEYIPDEAQFVEDDILRPTAASTQSLLRPDHVESDSVPEVPFDVQSETGSQHQSPQNGKGKVFKPQKSIVDERTVDSGHSLATSTTNSTPSSRVNLGQRIEPSTWDPNREIQALKKHLASTSFLMSLSKVSPGDDDVQLEKERLDKDRSAEGKSSGSTTSLSSSSSSNLKSKNSNASSFLSSDDSNARYLNIPFHIEQSPACNQGLFNALNSAINHKIIDGYKSVGLAGMPTDELPEKAKDAISDRLVVEKGCHVVYVPDSEREGHYDGYCKEFLWPTFHCQIPDVPTSKAYEEHSWGDYVKVNQAIADKIVEVYQPGDSVWVHDYHLMLVPNMVREQLPHAPIGFFMHVAFPSSEVFRCLAYRAELLSGVLAANSIAFHVPEYAQHFKMCLARILAVDITGPGVIEEEDHDAFVTSTPLGVDTERLDRILDVNNPDSTVQQHRRVIRKRWPYHRIIAARDKSDPIRGLPQKLKAFDQFLSENPQWAAKVVLVQICTSSQNKADETVLETLIDQINSKYGDLASGVQPVVLLKHDVKYEQYLALLSEADGFCVSCLRDGMNLTCHEYAYCNSSERMGPLILSEFTGSASVLGDFSILINPWDKDQVSQAFKTCVEMPRWERETRWRGLKQDVIRRPASLWAKELTHHIAEAWEDEMSRECVKPDVAKLEALYDKVVNDEKRLFFLEVVQPSTLEGQKVLNQEQGPKVIRRYDRRMSDSRLNSNRPYYTTRIPLDIRELCSDPRNIVYLISAESPDHMEWMYRALPGLGLIAEFGKYVRKHGETDWVELKMDADNHWQKRMEPWLKLLDDRSLASQITIHDSSITVTFNIAMDPNDEQRDLSMVGEYVALLNDHYAKELGVRTKLEGHVLTLYRSNLGVQRKNAFNSVVSAVDSPIGLTLVAIQPFATEADDVIYEWADNLKTSKRTKELVTIVVGRHQSHAHFMVEGTNALLNLLHTMRTKQPLPKPRLVSHSSSDKQFKIPDKQAK